MDAGMRGGRPGNKQHKSVSFIDNFIIKELKNRLKINTGPK